MRAGDSVNYSIGQGDTLVTPIQMATIYAAISNGGTLYDPTVGKAVISADGKNVQEIAPKSHGKLPMTKKTRDEIDEALEGVATRGTAAWRFQGWPQDEIPMHAKTGTAEVYGKQTTSWFATYTKDYSIVMTISQGGTGSGASAPAVRKLYNALYGVSEDGKIDKRKALLPTPQKGLPKIESDGSIDSPKLDAYPPKKTEKETAEDGTRTVAAGPGAQPVSFDVPAAIVSTRGGSGNRAARRRTECGRRRTGRGRDRRGSGQGRRTSV